MSPHGEAVAGWRTPPPPSCQDPGTVRGSAEVTLQPHDPAALKVITSHSSRCTRQGRTRAGRCPGAPSLQPPG